MGEHLLHQVANLPHLELESLVGSIGSDEATLPFSLDHVEQLCSICVLADRKARPNLSTKAVSLARLERNAETTFAVHESGDVVRD